MDILKWQVEYGDAWEIFPEEFKHKLKKFFGKKLNNLTPSFRDRKENQSKPEDYYRVYNHRFCQTRTICFYLKPKDCFEDSSSYYVKINLKNILRAYLFGIPQMFKNEMLVLNLGTACCTEEYIIVLCDSLKSKIINSLIIIGMPLLLLGFVLMVLFYHAKNAIINKRFKT